MPAVNLSVVAFVFTSVISILVACAELVLPPVRVEESAGGGKGARRRLRRGGGVGNQGTTEAGYRLRTNAPPVVHTVVRRTVVPHTVVRHTVVPRLRLDSATESCNVTFWEIHVNIQTQEEYR